MIPVQYALRRRMMIDSGSGGGETWYFAENPDWGQLGHAVFDIGFVSDGVHYERLQVSGMPFGDIFMVRGVYYYEVIDTDSGVEVWTSSGDMWTSEVFRTIVLDEPATGDFLAFLTLMAVRV